jgi:hypothetical protein
MRTDILKKLSAHLRTEEVRKKFYFNEIVASKELRQAKFPHVNPTCGTCGCALGHLPDIDPKRCRIATDSSGDLELFIDDKIIKIWAYPEVIVGYLEITNDSYMYMSYKIFFSFSYYRNNYHINSREQITAEMVADEIDALVDKYERSNKC